MANKPSDETTKPPAEPLIEPDRRRFIKLASCALGGGMGAAILVPALRVLGDPTNRTIVTTPSDPIDVGSLERLVVGAAPIKLDVVAPVIRDAWNASENVSLGAAWVQRQAGDKIVALSSICPHLGCAIGWSDKKGVFQCPCPPLQRRSRLVFRNGQRIHVANATLVEVARSGMVNRMGAPPKIIRRKGQHTQRAANELIASAGWPKRSVATIVLDDEHADQKATRRQAQR